MKAKTAFFYGPHDLRIEKVEMPVLKTNQVLVKVGACGVADIVSPFIRIPFKHYRS